MPWQSPRRAQERALHPQRGDTLGRIEDATRSDDSGMRLAQHGGKSAEWNEKQQSGADKTEDGFGQGSPISPR